MGAGSAVISVADMETAMKCAVTVLSVGKCVQKESQEKIMIAGMKKTAKVEKIKKTESI
jgi:hypothetical protein